MSPTERPSPWRTAFAHRTYASGLLWSAGVALSWLTGVPDSGGWLVIRLDAVGLLYMAASAVGGANFFGAAFRAARTLRLDMNFLMSAWFGTSSLDGCAGAAPCFLERDLLIAVLPAG